MKGTQLQLRQSLLPVVLGTLIVVVGFFATTKPSNAVCCCMQDGGTQTCQRITSTACVDKQKTDARWSPLCNDCESIGGKLQCPDGSTTAGAICDPNQYDVGKLLPPCTKCGTCGLEEFLQLFVNLYSFGLHNILAPLAVLFIIIGSIRLLTASGYHERIEQGRTMIAQTIAGVIVVLISWVVIDTTIYLLTGNRDRTILSKKWYGGNELTYPCYISKTVSLQNGCSGVDVQALQQNLSRLGYTVKADSVYGPQTSAAVRKFQDDVNSNLMVMDGRSSCSVPLWDQIFYTDWNKTGQQFSGTTSCEIALASNEGSTADVWCVKDSLTVSANTLPANGIDDQKTNNLITLFAGTFAGDYQTHCKK